MTDATGVPETCNTIDSIISYISDAQGSVDILENALIELEKVREMNEDLRREALTHIEKVEELEGENERLKDEIHNIEEELHEYRYSR